MFRLFILCNLYETLLETANNIRLRGSKHWDQWLETILVRCVFPFLIFCSSNQMAEGEAVRADEFGTIKQEVYIYIFFFLWSFNCIRLLSEIHWNFKYTRRYFKVRTENYNRQIKHKRKYLFMLLLCFLSLNVILKYNQSTQHGTERVKKMSWKALTFCYIYSRVVTVGLCTTVLACVNSL